MLNQHHFPREESPRAAEVFTVSPGHRGERATIIVRRKHRLLPGIYFRRMAEVLSADRMPPGFGITGDSLLKKSKGLPTGICSTQPILWEFEVPTSACILVGF